MKRRNFLQLVASSALAAGRGPRPIQRTSRLFDLTPADPLTEVHWMAQIMPLEDRIVSLRYTQEHSGIVNATFPGGEASWEHQLPRDSWGGGLGASDGGKSILVCTMQSTIFGLATRTGDLTILGKAKSPSVEGRLSYAGDGFLIRTSTHQIELWRVDPAVEVVRRIPVELPVESRVDVLAPGWAAVASADGSAAWLIETATGRFREYEIDTSAITSLKIAKVITGSDRQLKLLYMLLVPSESGEPMPCVAMDAEGNVRRHGTFERQPKGDPARFMKYGSELGIANHDGTVAWYAE